MGKFGGSSYRDIHGRLHVPSWNVSTPIINQAQYGEMAPLGDFQSITSNAGGNNFTLPVAENFLGNLTYYYNKMGKDNPELFNAALHDAVNMSETGRGSGQPDQQLQEHMKGWYGKEAPVADKPDSAYLQRVMRSAISQARNKKSNNWLRGG